MADSDEGGAGIGGWLALFVFVIAGWHPLTMIASIAVMLYGDPAVAAAFGDRWQAVQIFQWSLTAAATAFCWFIAWRLTVARVWTTVRITITGIWILAVVPVLIGFAGYTAITGWSLDAISYETGRAMAGPILFAIVWTAYFLRSRRVRNTYRRPGRAAQEIFG